MACWFVHTSEPRFLVGSPGWRCPAHRGSHSLGPPRWSQDLPTPASPAPHSSRSAPGSYKCVILIRASKLEAAFRSLFEVPQETCALLDSPLWLSLDIWFELRRQIQGDQPVYRWGADVTCYIKMSGALHQTPEASGCQYISTVQWPIPEPWNEWCAQILQMMSFR